MTIPDNILKRAAALKAMAEHKGSNVHEATIAAQQLAKLLAAYGLEDVPAGDDRVDAPIGCVTIRVPQAAWVDQLIHAAIGTNNVRAVWMMDGRVDLFGKRHEIEIARYVLDALRHAVDALARQQANTDRTWRNAYRLGAATAICDGMLREWENAQTADDVPAATMALMTQNAAALDAAVRRAYPNMKTASSTVRYGSKDAYGRGVADGSGIRAAAGVGAPGGSAPRLGAG